MSSFAISLTAWLLAPSTHATDTARNAGCEIDEVRAKSESCVELLLQSSSVQNASGSRVQSLQKRGGGGVIGGGMIGPARPLTSPSPISASHAIAGSAGRSSPQPAAPASAEHTNTEKIPRV